MKNTLKKIKCMLPKNKITYNCTPSLTHIWKTKFKGKYKTNKYKTTFKLNNKMAILDTDKDTSLTNIIYDGKQISVNLERNPYKVLQKINNLLSK
jgi:isocitrate lyase